MTGLEVLVAFIIVTCVYESVKRYMKHKQELLLKQEETKQLEIKRDMGIWEELDKKKELED